MHICERIQRVQDFLGHQLASFMTTHDALVAHPAMVDLAQLEWALRHAFDAAHATPLDVAELAALPVQDWPDDVPVPDALAHHVLVWRVGLHNRWQSLSDAQTVFVQGPLASHTFGDICAALAQQQGDDAAASVAVAVLHELLGRGVISGHAGLHGFLKV